jgi:CRISPR-associated protein Csb2
VPLLKDAAVWQSVTPYLHPWHRKKSFGIEAQIRRECRERGLPDLDWVQPIDEVSFEGRRLRPIDFHRFRRKHGLVQPDTYGSLWQLRFSEPVSGVLALGFGNHFGLGLFKPLE